MPNELSGNNAIQVKGARVHNLKNVSINIPRDLFIVITGLSGSGKSSLAFDTIYAEGQRRYVESLSSYARQFLGRINKPEVDFIKGIPPAIAIEQRVNTRNPRSTVGTSTEIYDYLKLLYARIGKTYSPISGNLVKRQSVTDVVNYMLALPHGTKIIIHCPIIIKSDRTILQQLEILLQQGFTRVHITPIKLYEKNSCKFQEGDYKIADIFTDATISECVGEMSLIIDRMAVDAEEDTVARMSDSVQTAFFEGKGECWIRVFNEEGEATTEYFSNRFELDGIEFEDPTLHTFSFNNPVGACPTCEGFGKVMGIDEDLVVPDKNRSVYDDAVACWRGEKMSWWKDQLVMCADKFDFPIHKPYSQLTAAQRKLLWTGNKHFQGIDAFFKDLESNNYKIQFRVMLSRYRGKTNCPDCNGTRLKKEAGYVKVNDMSIHDLVLMPIQDLRRFFDTIELNEYDYTLAKRIMTELRNRLLFLDEVGLGYLDLNRLSATLSGGESQRINLATSLGSSLVGSIYILDEPSIGLHPRDTHRLIRVMRKLKAMGNTVLVVEHDEEIIRAADQVIDIGPFAGSYGGEVVFQGNKTACSNCSLLP